MIENQPRHIAIIMDGNGRWAQQRGLPRVEGHRRGVSTVRMVCETATELKLNAVTLYCLSSENWKRPQAEIDFLMHLLEQYLVEERELIMEQGLVLRVIGRRDRLPASVLHEMDQTISMSANNGGTNLVLAIDYGGRDELTRATQQIVAAVQRGELSPSAISESTINDFLYTSGLPDPDLLIRTGGEMRISNFLLWQISYAELWVTERAWPEFTREDLLGAIHEFAGRDRRFGGIDDSAASTEAGHA
jgi:undecaprenyl diphosphate synthase